MSKHLSSIQPLKVTYRLRDIFEALEKELADVQCRLSQSNSQPLLASVYKSQLHTNTQALSMLLAWREESIELLETDATLSESSIPAYIHQKSLCEQLNSGRLSPVRA